MRITAKLDVTPVTTYYHQLAVAVGQGLEKTIRMEAAATVRKASQLSPVKPLGRDELSDSARINAARYFSEGSTTGMVSSGRKGHIRGAAYVYETGFKGNAPLYRIWQGAGPLQAPENNVGIGFRVKDQIWNRWKTGYVKAIREAQIMAQKRIGARGLTQKSWFELMLKIANGAPINAPATIMRARPVKGGSRQIAAAVAIQTPTSFTLSVVNSSGLAIMTDGQRKLNAAISIRRTFFRRSLERGFFSDVKFISRQYPWAKVSTS